MKKEKYILDICDKDVFKEVKVPQPKTFKKRVTVKAVIKKGEKFVFVTDNIFGFVTLAGGGAKSKNLEKEIEREVLEETGFKNKVVKNLFIDRSLRNKGMFKNKGRDMITHSFLIEVLKKNNIDLRTKEEKERNMGTIILDKDIALYRMELQKRAVEAGVYREHYNINFNILRDYEIFKKFINESK